MGQARDFATRLRDLGCRFALDDFGAGFATFYYLKRMPLDTLKIEGDFVRSIRSSGTDQLLVSHMAMLAAGLGMHTIAEFVEDEATLEVVAGYEIDAAQGHWIGMPEPAFEGDELPPLGIGTEPGANGDGRRAGSGRVSE